MRHGIHEAWAAKEIGRTDLDLGRGQSSARLQLLPTNCCHDHAHPKLIAQTLYQKVSPLFYLMPLGVGAFSCPSDNWLHCSGVASSLVIASSVEYILPTKSDLFGGHP